ncbi:MAG TPA: KH domain-containing protein [Patescibacteria group bacterium]|nr:KH domain-containing protein [Patescibacteria group bacterium]
MNNSIDQQFIEFVVKSLVNNPDAVKVERTIDEKGVLLELTVDPEDLGRVIGKRGATAQSLRTLLRALGTKNDARYNLKIVDNGEAPPRRSQASSDDTAPTDSSTGTHDDSDNTNDDVTADDIVTSEDEDKADETADTSDRISKTRAELEDLDDLDV